MKNSKLTEAQREELILNILTDAVIFNKVGDLICELSGGYFDLDSEYTGYNNAVVLLGITYPLDSSSTESDHVFHEKLCDIFLNNVSVNCKRNNCEEKEPREVAKQILKEWRALIADPGIRVELLKY